MSCLFTLVFTQKGVTRHPELLWEDGTELEPGMWDLVTVPPGAEGPCVHTLHLSGCKGASIKCPLYAMRIYVAKKKKKVYNCSRNIHTLYTGIITPSRTWGRSFGK